MPVTIPGVATETVPDVAKPPGGQVAARRATVRGGLTHSPFPEGIEEAQDEELLRRRGTKVWAVTQQSPAPDCGENIPEKRGRGLGSGVSAVVPASAPEHTGAGTWASSRNTRVRTMWTPGPQPRNTRVRTQEPGAPGGAVSTGASVSRYVSSICFTFVCPPPSALPSLCTHSAYFF